MASNEITMKLDDSDRELIRRLTDAIEGARPPRSNSVQPLVGPPDVNQGEPAALARPATIAKILAYLNRRRAHFKNLASECYASDCIVDEYDEIIQWVEELGRRVRPRADC